MAHQNPVPGYSIPNLDSEVSDAQSINLGCFDPGLVLCRLHIDSSAWSKQQGLSDLQFDDLIEDIVELRFRILCQIIIVVE